MLEDHCCKVFCGTLYIGTVGGSSKGDNTWSKGRALGYGKESWDRTSRPRGKVLFCFPLLFLVLFSPSFWIQFEDAIQIPYTLTKLLFPEFLDRSHDSISEIHRKPSWFFFLVLWIITTQVIKFSSMINCLLCGVLLNCLPLIFHKCTWLELIK